VLVLAAGLLQLHYIGTTPSSGSGLCGWLSSCPAGCSVRGSECCFFGQTHMLLRLVAESILQSAVCTAGVALVHHVRGSGWGGRQGGVQARNSNGGQGGGCSCLHSAKAVAAISTAVVAQLVLHVCQICCGCWLLHAHSILYEKRDVSSRDFSSPQQRCGFLYAISAVVLHIQLPRAWITWVSLSTARDVGLTHTVHWFHVPS
jgi:hypothetical protein